MSFPNINVNLPVGTQRPMVLDDEIRQLKNDVIKGFKEISGFPDVAAVVLPVWTTETRPETTKERVFGYNSDTSKIEVLEDGEFKSLKLISENATTVGGIRITIGALPPAYPVESKELWIDTTGPLIKIYSGGGWKACGAVYI